MATWTVGEVKKTLESIDCTVLYDYTCGHYVCYLNGGRKNLADVARDGLTAVPRFSSEWVVGWTEL